MFYKIVDNFLPKNEFKIIQDLFYSQNFPWYYNKGVAYTDISPDGIYFTHLFYFFQKDDLNVSSHYNCILPIISRLDVKSILRIKGNLYSKTNTIFEHGAHIDYDFNHKGFLYYVNTNNGFTKLSNGIKVESVENRGLFFDPSLIHNSSTCSDSDSRININFNYL